MGGKSNFFSKKSCFNSSIVFIFAPASGSSSVGRAPAFQAGCREFEPRLPLYSSLPSWLSRVRASSSALNPSNSEGFFISFILGSPAARFVEIVDSRRRVLRVKVFQKLAAFVRLAQASLGRLHQPTKASTFFKTLFAATPTAK